MVFEIALTAVILAITTYLLLAVLLVSLSFIMWELSIAKSILFDFKLLRMFVVVSAIVSVFAHYSSPQLLVY